MESSPHILIVDDDHEIRELLARLLTKEGLRVSTASDGKEMRQIMGGSKIDLVVLDLMLPGDDGLTICRRLRAESSVPIIMLTAKGEEFDRVLGLEMGADDYVPKPFSSRELLARIRAILRRSKVLPETPEPKKDEPLRFAGWKFDVAKRELESADGVIVPLSTGEFDLLVAFVQHPNRVLSREQLLDLARGRGVNVFDRSIDAQVSRLRKKIEEDPRDPKIVKTVWGGGYIFTSEIVRP